MERRVDLLYRLVQRVGDFQFPARCRTWFEIDCAFVLKPIAVGLPVHVAA
jgi:hypothetical protein